VYFDFGIFIKATLINGQLMQNITFFQLLKYNSLIKFLTYIHTVINILDKVQ